MKNIGLFLIVLMYLVSSSSSATFFENSRRRVANLEDLKFIVKINGCTGFYVKNDKDKNLVITARHCLNYSASSFCSRRGRVFDVKYGNYRHCKKAEIASNYSDIVLLELEETNARSSLEGYSLASFLPSLDTNLKVVGFPSDPKGDENGNVSDNCSVMSSEIVFPYKNTAFWNDGLQDPAVFHNCSVYGGNSGGPMLSENSEIVLGLPNGYAEGIFYNLRENHKIGTIALMNFFVDFNKSKLTSLGVSLKNQDERVMPLTYLRSGQYRSIEDSNCILSLKSYFQTSSTLKKLDIEKTGSCEGITNFTCVNQICESTHGEILRSNGNKIAYFDYKGDEVSFLLESDF